MRYPTAPSGVVLNVEQPRVPIYVAIIQKIRSEIEQGVWRTGEMIPSEPQLAQTYQSSTGTVRKALQYLVTAGFLYRIQGKGTFVAGSFIRSKKLKFYQTQNAFGAPDRDTFARFLSCREVAPNAAANSALQIDRDARLIEIVRAVRTIEGPLNVVYSYFDYERFGSLLDKTGMDFEKKALTLIMEQDYNIPTVSANELISVVTLPLEVCAILELPEGSTGLLIEMLSFSYRDKPYEYRRAYCIPGKKFFRSY